MLENGIDVRKLIGIIQRQLRLIFSVVAIVIGAAAIYVLAQPPLFTANALVLVDPRQKNMLDPQSQISLLPTDNARIESEVEILRSPTTFHAVALNNSLVSDPEFDVRPNWHERLISLFGIQTAQGDTGPLDRHMQRVVDALEDSTTISRKGLTYLIGVDVRSQDPKKAANLANAVADTYIKHQIEAKVANAITVGDALDGRLRQEAGKLSSLEEKIDGFVAANLDKVADESSRADIAQLRVQLGQNKEQMATATAEAQAVGLQARKGNWPELASRLESQAMAELAKQRKALSSDIRALDAGSAEAVNLRSKLARIDRQLEAMVAAEVEKLRHVSMNATEEQRKLRDQMRGLILAGNLPNDVVVQLYQLEQEADVSRALYQELLQRLRGVEAQTDLQAADSRVVSRATPPSEPSSPKAGMILGLALAGSLGLGFGLAVLYENYVAGLTCAEQLEAVIGAPVLSSVPRLSTSGKGDRQRREVCTEILSRPLSAYSESVRRLRLGIERLARKEEVSGKKPGGIVVMMASAVPGEGKTTTAVSLARTFALADKRVLVIDCDLLHPSVARNVGIDPQIGLADFLSWSGKDMNQALIRQDPEAGVDLLPGRSGKSIPVDRLLESSRFSRLIEAAKNRYHFVILDTPPLLPVADGQLLAGSADIVVLVVRWASTSQQEVRSAVSELRRAAGENLVLGAVLAQVNSSAD